ncbi:hypothetical protein IU433_12220 [Nocardia puris]|uniref:hypothetical protein n=1 Tax=Nocardia puris TaxID=208602 RepID=UPI00189620EE|nr:hypothetical protein [Nocardia puris]MBF6459802.1 hypothetical protein [Nocardia puris]
MAASRSRTTPADTGSKSKRVKDPYIHKIGATEVSLPSLTYLKPGIVRRVRRMDNIDAMYTVMELLLDPDVLELIDEMDPEDYEELLAAWREHSGLSLGES